MTSEGDIINEEAYNDCMGIATENQQPDDDGNLLLNCYDENNNVVGCFDCPVGTVIIGGDYSPCEEAVNDGDADDDGIPDEEDYCDDSGTTCFEYCTDGYWQQIACGCQPDGTVIYVDYDCGPED